MILIVLDLFLERMIHCVPIGELAEFYVTIFIEILHEILCEAKNKTFIYIFWRGTLGNDTLMFKSRNELHDWRNFAHTLSISLFCRHIHLKFMDNVRCLLFQIKLYIYYYYYSHEMNRYDSKWKFIHEIWANSLLVLCRHVFGLGVFSIKLFSKLVFKHPMRINMKWEQWGIYSQNCAGYRIS